MGREWLSVHSSVSSWGRALDHSQGSLSLPNIPFIYISLGHLSCPTFAVRSPFQYQAWIPVADVISVIFNPFSVEKHHTLVPISPPVVCSDILEEMDTFISRGTPSLCFSICWLSLGSLFSFHWVELEYTAACWFLPLCWFWHVSSPNVGPFWVAHLETLSMCRAPSVPGKYPFPKASPFVFLPGGRMPFAGTFLLSHRTLKGAGPSPGLQTKLLWIVLLIVVHMKYPQITKH